MKFIHLADVHLGARPDAGNAYSKERSREIWNSFASAVQACNDQEIDLLLIAGDLFHRQPLLRELKEVNYLFRTLKRTQVVLIAGNHDYLKKDSYYRTFPWAEHVHMILDGRMSCVELPGLQTAVYGMSYESREILENHYDHAFPKGRQTYEILLAHGGDEKHIPIQRKDIISLGYDYVALGHIHKPQTILKNRVVYAGALEPIDKNDTGVHGYVKGELTKEGCKVQFVPSAGREYIHTEIEVDKTHTGYEVKNQIRERIEMLGVQNIYQIRLTGFRDPDTAFDLAGMDIYGNIVELTDDTKPAYAFERLMEQNRENLLGKYIESLIGYDKDSMEYQALCEGVQALMETRRG